jgi:molecular chaperone GrpE
VNDGNDEVKVRVTDKRLNVDEPAGEEPAVLEAEVVEEEPAPVDELAQARQQAAGYLDDLQRLKAEFENFRKRMVKEQTMLVERASAAVVERMLPILDNFELALMAADRTKDYESMVRGVEMVYGELLDVLRKEGLERIDALHQPFDPAQHDAVMHAVEGDGEEIVVEEMRPGYRFAGRVLRPSMVKVGTKN